MTARERERREFERRRALTCSCGHRTAARDYYAAVRELALHVRERLAHDNGEFCSVAWLMAPADGQLPARGA